MEVMHVKKYNEKQTAKWQKNFNETLEDIKHGKRNASELPQLAFYIFNKNYGYVATNGNKALWHKTKKGVIERWEAEEKRKKIRGY